MTPCNIKNRTIFCKDNIDVLEGINSESIDLIYHDPPFNSNKTYPIYLEKPRNISIF